MRHDLITLGPNDIKPDALSRANTVRDRLQRLGGSLQDSFFEICDLLMEAHENAYHTCYGYGSFGDWVEQGSGLDLSSRQGFYYVNIGKKAKQLGLSREQLGKAKISKLKQIFALEPLEHGNEMKQLVAAAETESLDDISSKVRELRKSVGKSTNVVMRISIEPEAKEVVDEAFELARRNYGSTVQDGEVRDISDGKCLELISAEYLGDSNNSDLPEFGSYESEETE